MRKVFRTIRTIITKGWIGLNFILFAMSICGLDSDHWKAMLAICAISFANLAIWAIANGAMEW